LFSQTRIFHSRNPFVHDQPGNQASPAEDAWKD
jgi:hypothetical protein